MTDIQRMLFALRDPAYQAFQSKLMPTVDPETVIGVRMPALRQLAKELARTPLAEDFLRQLRRVVPEGPWTQQVAGGPVVHMGQEFLQCRHSGIIVRDG